ncbi:ferritin-like domain-containing protein [Actinopolyspora halophila]|uniref:ferritin-like domain-containing protein n=1 Tax=Actinopolyspora halophila TaxID=1850 RepID=UPI0003634F82|nr:ferritin-like domain-containing protein [Actinopolyspora halophila]
MSSAELSETGARVLERALGAEHAAVWLYGLAKAFAQDSGVVSAVDEGTSAHRGHRDRTRRLLRAAGNTPPPADPAYRPPESVTDQASAVHALIAAEQDCSVGWLAVLERSENRRLSQLALDCLTGAATRATTLRLEVGEQPGTPAFPGRT